MISELLFERIAVGMGAARAAGERPYRVVLTPDDFRTAAPFMQRKGPEAIAHIGDVPVHLARHCKGSLVWGHDARAHRLRPHRL